MFLFIHAGFALIQSKSRHFTRGNQNNGKFSVRKLWLVIDEQILKMTLPQKIGHRIKTPSSKLTILVSYLAGKRILHTIMHTSFSFCPLFSSNYWSKVLHSFWATLYSIVLRLHWAYYWNNALKAVNIFILWLTQLTREKGENGL